MDIPIIGMSLLKDMHAIPDTDTHGGQRGQMGLPNTDPKPFITLHNSNTRAPLRVMHTPYNIFIYMDYGLWRAPQNLLKLVVLVNLGLRWVCQSFWRHGR